MGIVHDILEGDAWRSMDTDSSTIVENKVWVGSTFLILSRFGCIFVAFG